MDSVTKFVENRYYRWYRSPYESFECASVSGLYIGFFRKDRKSIKTYTIYSARKYWTEIDKPKFNFSAWK